MRILHVGKYFQPFKGGIENFVRDLAGAQAAAGDRVRVLVHHHELMRPPVRERFGEVEVVREPTVLRAVHTPLSPAFVVGLPMQYREFRPDVVHVHMPNVSAFWALFLPRSVPVVVHWHADVASARERLLRVFYPGYALLERRLLRRAARIIATSPDYLAASAALTSVRDKCRIVPLGLDPERVAEPDEPALERARKLAGEGAFALSVGRFTYYKGFQHLLEAVAMVPHGRAVMVGEGPLRAQMIRRAAELNLSERIIFTGRLPDTDLHALMRLCRVFVLPSIERTEAFGLVLAEAMRYGTPCISTRVPGSGMSWVNREGETGLTVAPGDAAGLAEAMSRMFASDDLRDMLAAGALERFAELFHIDAVARMVRGVYEESLSRSA